MGSPLIKRLDVLYQRAQMVMKVQADHAPFVSIAPWSFIKDECIVKYYPEGHYQKPEQITTTLHDALMIAQYYYECGVYVQFTMSLCIDNVLKRLRQQGIEIERFTHHAFRDTFATRYIEEGGNMQTLQKILGHSSLAMTADLYAHVLPNTKQQEMQQIEKGFIGVAVL